MNEQKRCLCCGVTKPVSEFHRRNDRPGGLQSKCKECRKEHDAKRYESQEFRAALRMRQQSPEYQAKRKEYRLRPDRIEADRKRVQSEQYKAHVREHDKIRRKRPERIAAERERQRGERHLSNLRRRHAERKQYDLQYKIKRILRSRITAAVKCCAKSGSAVALLGCSIDFFKDHIASQFNNGMSWDNHGEWHLDHKKPLSAFDLTNPEHMQQACHYTNLQPLWAVENISKGGAR